MKQQILAFMVSATVFATSPAFGMDDEGDSSKGPPHQVSVKPNVSDRKEELKKNLVALSKLLQAETHLEYILLDGSGLWQSSGRDSKIFSPIPGVHNDLIALEDLKNRTIKEIKETKIELQRILSDEGTSPDLSFLNYKAQWRNEEDLNKIYRQLGLPQYFPSKYKFILDQTSYLPLSIAHKIAADLREQLPLDKSSESAALELFDHLFQEHRWLAAFKQPPFLGTQMVCSSKTH